MYGYVCICQSKIQDRYYCPQDPIMSMSIIILTMLPSAYFAKATRFFLPLVRHTTNALSPALYLLLSALNVDIPCPWSIITTLKRNDRFKNGPLTLSVLLSSVLFSWRCSPSGTTLHIYLIIFLSKLNVNSLRAGFHLFHSQMSPRLWSSDWHTVDIK